MMFSGISILPRLQRSAARALGSAIAGAALVAPAHAQTFPERQIVIIAPSPAGSSDAPVRLFVPGLAEALGHPVVVENRPGGSANVGHTLGARAAPDGHTLTYVSTVLTINPYLYQAAGYKLADFAPITQLTSQDNAIAVNASLPVNNLTELVAHVKANSNKLSFADQGGNQLLSMSIFLNAMGMKFLMVPYNSAPMSDLVKGDVLVTANSSAQLVPLHKSGKVRIVGWTGPKRREDFPDMQIGAELVPGWTFQSWNGLAAPAGTPRDRIARIQQAAATVVKRPEVIAALAKSSVDAIGSTPEEFGAFLKDSDARMSKIIKELNMLGKYEPEPPSSGRR